MPGASGLASRCEFTQCQGLKIYGLFRWHAALVPSIGYSLATLSATLSVKGMESIGSTPETEVLICNEASEVGNWHSVCSYSQVLEVLAIPDVRSDTTKTTPAKWLFWLGNGNLERFSFMMIIMFHLIQDGTLHAKGEARWTFPAAFVTCRCIILLTFNMKNKYIHPHALH